MSQEYLANRPPQDSELLVDRGFQFQVDPNRLLPGTDMTLLDRAKNNQLLPANYLWATPQQSHNDSRSRKLRSMARSEAAEHQSVAQEKIIGSNDGRQPVADTSVYPFSAVCCIYSTFPTPGTMMGTGCLISSNVVLTVAHNLYCPKYGEYATAIKVMRGVNGSVDNVKFVKSGSDSWLHPSYPGARGSAKRQYDYALLRLNSPYTKGGTLGVGVYTNATFAERENYYIPGYPAEAGHPRKKQHLTMWAHSQKKVLAGSRVLRYAVDTWAGQSGAPIIDRVNVNGTPRYVVVGIHSGWSSGLNEGVRITEDVWNVIDKWI